jgi:hypothetical protein
LGIAVFFVLWFGWNSREDSALTPNHGLGYWLGIAGTSSMLLSLIYPLRKRLRALQAIGSAAFWFRAHMMLGACGCVLILWHANFRLGSINSNMALLAMLVVAASGIVGRYLYAKVHRGLHGRRAAVQEIMADAEAIKVLLSTDLPVADHMHARMHVFAQLGIGAPTGILVGFILLLVIGLRGTLVRRQLMADVRSAVAIEAQRRRWPRRVRRQKIANATSLVTRHVAEVKKATAFALYDRLFRAWHVFHMPLFFLLVIAAAVHIYAAHLF